MRQEIYDSKQPRIEDCKTGRVYVRVNETEVKVTENVQTGVDTFEEHEVTKYRYDEEIVEVSSYSEENVLDSLKNKITDYITLYDKSDKVNIYSINSHDMPWLDKTTRDGLHLRFISEKNSGKKVTTLWSGTVSIELEIDRALQMLYAIEVYASECYDNTAFHKSNIAAMTSIQDVMNYDFTVGYPNKLNFEYD